MKNFFVNGFLTLLIGFSFWKPSSLIAQPNAVSEFGKNGLQTVDSEDSMAAQEGFIDLGEKYLLPLPIPSELSLKGYNVYMAANPDGEFNLINQKPVPNVQVFLVRFLEVGRTYYFRFRSMALDGEVGASSRTLSLMAQKGPYSPVAIRNGVSYKESMEESMSWFQKAADQGDPYAQYSVGRFYEKGWGVTRNYKEALQWFLKAAAKEYKDAQFALGFFYENGWGVQKDYSEALWWFRKAANQGSAKAENNIGLFYEAGQGVPRDYSEALKWFRKAADQGNVWSKKEIVKLENEMTK
ncbi:MAG TPA: tetratricopeptide repeat protein [bacterium]